MERRQTITLQTDIVDCHLAHVTLLMLHVDCCPIPSRPNKSFIQFLNICDIVLTCPCSVDPLAPHLYTVNLGFKGVYLIFLFLL